MVKNRNNSLFNPSGCLTLDAINLYLSRQLGNHELQQVEQHLAGCEICTDAAEGYTYLPDQSKQHHLITRIKGEIKSRYSSRSFHSTHRRDRRLNPTLVYISAAATVLIIFGIYGIVNTDIFRENKLVAEQIQEEKIEGKEIISEVEQPLSEATQEVFPETPEESDIFEPAFVIQEEENQEVTARIAEVIKVESEIIPELDEYLALEMEVMDAEKPIDTFVIDGVRDMGGVEAVASAGESVSRKAVAIPAMSDPADREKLAKRKMEDADTFANERIFKVVDEMPKFSKIGYKDFEEYIRKNIKYPPKAMDTGISGKVLVQFIVNEKGEVQDVEIKKGIDPLLDQEAARVINSSPKWEPGKKEGRKVVVQFVYPVLFQFED